MNFSFNTTASIRFGEGLAAKLGELCGTRLGERILFVTDPGLTKLGLTEPALASLRQSADVIVFDSVEADPSRKTLMSAVAAGKGVSGVVGFGGGSSMDVAKLSSLLLRSDQPLDEAWGVNNAKGPRLPLVLVPTTAGTGSEVTPIAIITVEGDEKRGVSSPVILPDMAVLDPSLTLGLPACITAATGIDAMVHAIEGYTSRSPNANPMSRMLAVQALQLLGANIEKVVADGSNVAARGAMLLGSMIAGQALANSPVAAVHALAYPIGGRYHVPHGLSNALVLPHVLRFNASAACDEYAQLSPHAFEGKAIDLAEGLSALSVRLGLPQRLRDVNVPQADLPQCAAAAMKQTRLLVNNPCPVTEADALRIYQAAW